MSSSVFRIEEYAEKETSVKAGGKEDLAECRSETSADFQRTIRRYNPEDRTLLNH
jgi:hypothetical protein